MAKKNSNSSRRGKQLPHASLGKRRVVKYTYDPKLLEAIPLRTERKFSDSNMWVSDCCLRFTSLCPVTGHPDWAELFINYIPHAHLIESKSLKEYLFSFRMHGDFHEDVCRIICDDLVKCIAPRYLEVLGHFDSRGSIAIWPYVQFAKPDDAEAEELRQYRLREYAPGKYVPTQFNRTV
jgi:7-cyano-7-deazaguanine reductase